jgi:hypothetical protein
VVKDIHIMHGNKKYKFERLKQKGDIITVETANIYSLRMHLRNFSKANELDFDKVFQVDPISLKKAKVTRIA